MSPFESRIHREVRIYNAGVRGTAVPYYPGMRVDDIEQLYTAGMMAALEEIDAAIPEPTKSQWLLRCLK